MYTDKSEVLAYVHGKEFVEIPDDLFIPPDALEVLLDSFSGPLDLLLYLIRKQNIDILDIPITSITQQYLQYIQLMESQRLELAADYLLMAAMLAEIKARLLLPSSSHSEEDEEDPRMSLVRKLQAYEQIKEAAQLLDALPRKDRDTFVVQINPVECIQFKVHPEVLLEELNAAMSRLVQREEQLTHHQVAREHLSVRERMSMVLQKLDQQEWLTLTQLFTQKEGRMGLTVSLLAVLELARQSLITMTQTQAFSPIYLQVA